MRQLKQAGSVASTVFVVAFLLIAPSRCLMAQTAAQTAPQEKDLRAGQVPSEAPGTATLDDTKDPQSPALEHRGERYRLCASDVIAVSFPLTPEFNQVVNVQPDGFASLSGAGELRLEGLTTEESATAIRAAFSKILHDPIVTVELKDYNKPYFIVSGQVHKPGKFDLRGYTTASEAVAIAGGFNESAKHSQVLLFRRKNDEWYEVKPLDLKKILQGREVEEDPEIRPGDMLFVPQNFISKAKKFIPSSGMGAYYQLRD